MAHAPGTAVILTGADPDSPACAASYLTIFEHILGERGIDTDAWIALAAIPDAEQRDPNGFISFAQMEKLLGDRNVVTHFHDIGCEVGEHLTISAHGLVGHLAMSGSTYMDSIRLFLRFMKLRTQLTRFDIAFHGLEVQISFDDAIEHAALRRLVIDSALSGSYHLTSQLLDNKRPVARIEFDGEPTPAQQAFAEKVYCPVTFGHPKPSVVINLVAALRPAITANPLLQKVAMQQCSTLMEELDATDSIRQKIRTLLNTVPEYALSQKRVAECLNMTPRTLRRRLAEEGTNFKDLSDQVMKDYVATLMQDRNVSVGEMADLLGYSNESNFNKAFRRWFGMSAAQYRDQHCPG